MNTLNIQLQYNLSGSKTDGSFTGDDSNSFFQSLQNSSNNSRKQIFRDFFLFDHGIVCCVYSLESPNRCVENRKDFPKLSLFAC